MNKIIVYRYNTTADSTIGLLFINSTFFGYTMEDTYRTTKIKGETRIPSGTYELSYNPTVTPLTTRYRNRFPWFKHHIQLVNVPNYDNVYIHTGNTAKDTDGCLLVGKGVIDNRVGITRSVEAFKEFYEFLYPKLLNKEKYTIEFKELPI